MAESHNPFGEPHASRNSWLDLTPGEGRHVVYSTGCTAAYREREMAEKTVMVLQRPGFPVTVLDEEWCCSTPLFRTGLVDTALQQAVHNVRLLNESSAEEVIVTRPGCYRALTETTSTMGRHWDSPYAT